MTWTTLCLLLFVCRRADFGLVWAGQRIGQRRNPSRATIPLGNVHQSPVSFKPYFMHSFHGGALVKARVSGMNVTQVYKA